MRTMTKERKKEGPRLKGKGRADAKASRQLLLLCIPAIIGYILFNYIPMGAAVIIASVDKGIHNKTTKYGLPTY